MGVRAWLEVRACASEDQGYYIRARFEHTEQMVQFIQVHKPLKPAPFKLANNLQAFAPQTSFNPQNQEDHPPHKPNKDVEPANPHRQNISQTSTPGLQTSQGKPTSAPRGKEQSVQITQLESKKSEKYKEAKGVEASGQQEDQGSQTKGGQEKDNSSYQTTEKHSRDSLQRITNVRSQEPEGELSAQLQDLTSQVLTETAGNSDQQSKLKAQDERGLQVSGDCKQDCIDYKISLLDKPEEVKELPLLTILMKKPLNKNDVKRALVLTKQLEERERTLFANQASGHKWLQIQGFSSVEVPIAKSFDKFTSGSRFDLYGSTSSGSRMMKALEKIKLKNFVEKEKINRSISGETAFFNAEIEILSLFEMKCKNSQKKTVDAEIKTSKISMNQKKRPTNIRINQLDIPESKRKQPLGLDLFCDPHIYASEKLREIYEPETRSSVSRDNEDLLDKPPILNSNIMIEDEPGKEDDCMSTPIGRRLSSAL